MKKKEYAKPTVISDLQQANNTEASPWRAVIGAGYMVARSVKGMTPILRPADRRPPLQDKPTRNTAE